jgi:plastocyanin
MGLGAVYSRTFTSVGTLTYFCEFHPILMGTAVVVVQP